MGISVSFFDSVEELVKHVDEQLAETRSLLASHLRRVEVARKKFNEANSSSTKSAANSGHGAKQAEVAGFRVLVNPTADYELNILDEAVKSTQETLETLERARKQLLPTMKSGTRIAAIYDDGLPTAFMYYVDR